MEPADWQNAVSSRMERLEDDVEALRKVVEGLVIKADRLAYGIIATLSAACATLVMMIVKK